MLKKSASGVLASLRSSTYRGVRLASSLAAALLNGLFEHPARCSPIVLDIRAFEFPPCHNSFSVVCSWGQFSFDMEYTRELGYCAAQSYQIARQ
jgi:hypothetical protein